VTERDQIAGFKVNREGALWNIVVVRDLWRRAFAGGVDHQEIMARINAESGWSPRYLFMILMSAGISVLGLLQSSPAVVIGAMLISPLMNPILGFGFSLAVFDFYETRRSFFALLMGSICAVVFTAFIVLASPLKDVTSEILSRTRPNLFDLLIALFASLAGAYAIIRGGGGTIVGVAIATALMPPLAVVGYGLATWNLPILLGALALFATNFVTIALSATIMARLFGFGHTLSSHQNWLQTILLVLVFVGLSIPLGLSLNRIAGEALTESKVRTFLTKRFGATGRISHIGVDFESDPLAIHAVIIAPRSDYKNSVDLQTGLKRALGRSVALQVDQLLVDPRARSIEAQRGQLREEAGAASAARADEAALGNTVAIAAGIAPTDVVLDAENKRVSATASSLPGADLATYRALEQRVAASSAASGWRIKIVPPYRPMPIIRFANGSDAVDPVARDAISVSAWAALRWNVPALGVPGLPAYGASPKRPPLAQRRAIAIATILSQCGVKSAPLSPAGLAFRLSPTEGP
jgi:uncharacterized hydrophobic protein (TIGR00271 family)